MENTVTDSATSAAATQQTSPQNSSAMTLANRTLKYSTIFWFLAVMAGQWFFFYYIMTFYGFSVISNNMEIWNRWEAMGSTPFVAGDFGGNLAFAAHAIGGGIVAFGGALQLIPQLRSRFPKFHKVNGYTYLTTVFALAISGFYLVWIRDQDPIDMSGVGTSINGLLILSFAFLTVRFAIKRDITSHRKWALRLFLVANAQWILRVGVFSYLISGTLLGLEPSFGDPFFLMWTFGCYVIPLAALQLYFYAKEKRSLGAKYLASFVLVVLTLLMIIGAVGFTPFLLTVASGGEIAF